MGKKYKGTPYKWGGSAPGGFDCSGFIYYLYKKYKNKTIPRTAMTQFLAAKEIKTPKRGNLLFFSNPGCNYITHVGIYAGNNKMLHASSSNGIELTDLSNNYWQNRYVSAGAL